MNVTDVFIQNFVLAAALLLIGTGIPFLGYLMKSKIAIWIFGILSFFIGVLIFGMTHNSGCEGGAIIGLIWALRKHNKRQAVVNKEE